MLLKGVTTLTFAAACLTALAAVPAGHAQSYATPNQVLTNGPQSSGVARSGSWSARQNILESEHYSRLVATSPGFRRYRMRLECGPITDPVLHQNCIQSFAQNIQAWRDGRAQAFYRDALSGEAYGSSTPPQPYISSAGQ